jgi:uncharacterized protein YneF (UPF0154 family)
MVLAIGVSFLAGIGVGMYIMDFAVKMEKKEKR